MLNQSAEYALRAVTVFAGLAEDESVHAAELATTLGIPANYLSKILHQMAAAGILNSRRGRGGGFQLAVPASTLTLATVIEPFEDLTRYRTCFLGGAVCNDRAACAAHHEWKPIANAMLEFLTTTTCDTLAGKIR